MSVPRVTAVVPAAHLAGLVVEIVRDFRFRIAVHEPEQVHVVTLHSVLGVVFLAEEPTSRYAEREISICGAYR